jgi:hypothetical protein
MNIKKMLIIGMLASSFAACSTDRPPVAPEVQEVVTVNVTSYYNSIWFDHDSAKVSDDFAAILKLNADYLNANPTALVQLQGNASEIGSKEHNQKLATGRSHAVAKQLENLGVNPKQIQEISFGAIKPTFPNDKKGHSPQNRRVDIVYISGAPISYHIEQLPIVSTEDETVDFEPISIKGQTQITHISSSSPISMLPPVINTKAPADVSASAPTAATPPTASDADAASIMNVLPSN